MEMYYFDDLQNELIPTNKLFELLHFLQKRIDEVNINDSNLKNELIEKIHFIQNLLESECNDQDLFKQINYTLVLASSAIQKKKKITDNDLLNIYSILRRGIDRFKKSTSNLLNSENYYKSRLSELEAEEKKLIQQKESTDAYKSQLNDAINRLKISKAELKEVNNQLALSAQEKKEQLINIEELEKEKARLEEDRLKLKMKIEGLNIRQKEFHKLEDELVKIRLENDILKQQQSEAKKQNDAITKWENSIKSAFEEKLKPQLRTIENEHSRLKKMYWGYLVLSVILITFVVAIVVIIALKIISAKTLPPWGNYFANVLPVTVSLGLLWGFITQMNRSQRQMVVLAESIYNIQYVEGLLLSLNALSNNISESRAKVNESITKLLDSHLNKMTHPNHDESFLLKQEKKDSIPYEDVLKLIKGFVGKT